MNNQNNVIDEVQQNFLDSSYDVNTNRAFPNVRDGLKPGARAILWTMYKNKFTSDKPHVKSAKIDGSVAANYWPHGTTAIYETFVHMSQPFGMNNPEVLFHGNNGNIITGDEPASDRYTEAKLSKLTEEYVLDGVEKQCVPMIPNYLEDDEWPEFLPSVFPNLLVNGSQGIGVSLSQFFLPHNLKDTVKLISNYLTSGELDEDNYFPDFPTGGTIINKNELPVINKTGKGKVILRANYRVNKNKIIFYEMPYQVYIENTIEEIKDGIDKEKITNITDVYNDSDRTGIKLVVVCSNNKVVNKVLEQLFDVTHLQSQYNANQNAIVSKTPILLNLNQIVDYYIEFILTCIKKQNEFDLEKIKNRLSILKGLMTAVNNIDKVINFIKTSDHPDIQLIKEFNLTHNQVQAILNMKLNRLSHLEREKLQNEYDDKTKIAEELESIVNSKDKQKNIMIDKLQKMAEDFGSNRRTHLENIDITKAKSKSQKVNEDYIIEPVYWDTRVTYIKKIPAVQYKNKSNVHFKVSDKEKFLLFTDKGRFFRLAPKDIKVCGQDDKGTAIGGVLNLDNDENIIAIYNNVEEDKPYILFTTKNGYMLECEKKNFIGTTRNIKGMKSYKFKLDGDSIVSIDLIDKNSKMTITTNKPKKTEISSTALVPHGKNTSGAKMLSLSKDEFVESVKVK